MDHYILGHFQIWISTFHTIVIGGIYVVLRKALSLGNRNINFYCLVRTIEFRVWPINLYYAERLLQVYYSQDKVVVSQSLSYVSSINFIAYCHVAKSAHSCLEDLNQEKLRRSQILSRQSLLDLLLSGLCTFKTRPNFWHFYIFFYLSSSNFSYIGDVQHPNSSGLNPLQHIRSVSLSITWRISSVLIIIEVTLQLGLFK